MIVSRSCTRTHKDVHCVNRTKITQLSLLFDGMVVFRGLIGDPVAASCQSLLQKIGSKEFDLMEIYKDYHHFCSLATQVHWPDYLWERILQDDNELTRQAAQGGKNKVSTGLRQLAGRELLYLREIAELTAEEIKDAVNARCEEQGMENLTLWQEAPLHPKTWPIWISLQEMKMGDAYPTETYGQEESHAEGYLRSWQRRLKQSLLQGTAEEMVEALLSYYQTMGTGSFGQCMALKWRGETERLEGVRPDPMRVNKLINQEREQGIILQNTEFFLKDLPANNVILYGNRGTGKSSLVKALLQEYCDQGLRLVELSKTDLQDYPKIIRLLAKQPLKFILFIDDLSFEDTEGDYKNLKTLLEGGLEGKPQNVLIYATSNRRHLIRETFGERQVDEVHRRDNMEEKLSLSDRFGITVTFPTPDQEGYLKIVEQLAAQEGLAIPREDLRQQALRWVMNHNARSGRTARQFVDFLLAKQGMATHP